MNSGGLDVHWNTSAYCILNKNGKKIKTQVVKGGWNMLLQTLRKDRDLTGRWSVCFEASCSYGDGISCSSFPGVVVTALAKSSVDREEVLSAFEPRAVSLQVLMITPATGSKLYTQAFTSGMVYESAGGRRVEPYMLDANYVIASNHKQSWKKQLNIVAAYLYFYNPLRLVIALVRPKSRLYLADAGMQLIGMWGLTKTARRTLGWALRLVSGNILRNTTVPTSSIPMRSADGRSGQPCAARNTD